MTEFTFGDARKIYDDYKDYFDYDDPADVRNWIRGKMENACLRKRVDAQAQRIEELEAENRDLRAGLFSYKQGGFRVRGVVERYASERTGEVADEEAQADE